MIIDPREFDRDKHCTRYGYLTRLDGMVDVTPHDWGTWRKGKAVGTRERQCVTCWVSQVRETKDKRYKWPTKPNKRPSNAENIVNLVDFRGS